MEYNFKEKVYCYSRNIIKVILNHFNGQKVGGDEMNFDRIMEFLSEKPTIEGYLHQIKNEPIHVDKEIVDESLLQFEKCDVFTPDKISDIMSGFLKGGTLLEPSVGDGQLLKFIDFSKYSRVDIYDIKQEYLDKCPQQKQIRSYCKDFIRSDIHYQYDNIILNPPYIRIQDLSEEYRKYIKDKWPLLSKGNIDIYYAFLVKCLELLDNQGVMVAIIPNSYLTNKSAMLFRKFLIENRYIEKIIDFKSDKVFESVSTYCCITVFTKCPKKELVYTYRDDHKRIKYDDISEDNYNIFIQKNLGGKRLGDICKIRGGIATLRDKIYIHAEKKYNEPCWKRVTNSLNQSWIIFPYHEDGTLIEEVEFKGKNPKTYQYLIDNKEELLKRDKGKQSNYPSWYCYGRTQSLIKEKSEKVIYVSTFVDPNDIKYVSCKPQYNIGCLSISITDQEFTRGMVIDILEKNKEFIINNSGKRGGGWLNLSSGVLKKIPL